VELIEKKIAGYKRKFHTNLILRGALYTLAVLLSAYLFFIFLEYHLRGGSLLRGVLFFGYLLLCALVLYKWIFHPLLGLLSPRHRISDEQAAANIGSAFPDIRDKLLNLIQLMRGVRREGTLLAASIDQRARQLSAVAFEEAVDFRKNLHYLRYLFIPFVLVLFMGLYSPGMLVDPAVRIVRFNREYVPEAPFRFLLQNEALIAFQNEEFDLDLLLEGESIPENVYLVTAERRIKLNKLDINRFRHRFDNLREPFSFRFEASGFYSKPYDLSVVNRPALQHFDLEFNFPPYLMRPPERLSNSGNFQVPEGTAITWIFSTSDADRMALQFGEEEPALLEPETSRRFRHTRVAEKPVDYSVRMINRYSENRDQIRYFMDVIPDRSPEIELEQFRDTTFYDLLILGGNVSDDYGLSELKLFYRVLRDRTAIEEEAGYSSFDLGLDRSKSSQSFYHQWQLGEYGLSLGDELEYYLQVRDNDGLHGRKATRTPLYRFRVPDRSEMAEALDNSAKSTENQINKSVSQAESLRRQIEELDDRLKGKNQLDWQDQRRIEELIKQRESLQKSIEELQEQFRLDNEMRERFSDERSERIREKIEQLQQLMDDLLDEETRKLYDELQRLLEEHQSLDEIKKMIEQLNRKESNLENEIERTLELFKKMKFEFKLEQAVGQSRELGEKQEQLAEETLDKDSENQELIESQEELNRQFEELEKDLGDLHELNQDLRNPGPMQDLTPEQQEISKQQQQASEQLQDNKRKNAGNAQQKAAEQLRQMAKKLEEMQSMMTEASMDVNLNQLRDIVDNLLKLSFAQEDLMVEFRRVNPSDPRFLELSGRQLNLKDDAAVIQDSLLSLSRQEFGLSSFVTREVSDMNRYFDEALEAIRQRRKGEAVGKQQFAMTSINNLALMLDDVLTQMMNAMGQGAGQPMPSQTPSLSQLQQQLNQRISQLKQSGKQGRELSEELARMAAEQERIRQMLRELEEKMEMGQDGGGSSPLDELRQRMEQSELDLVNKQLTEQLIRRQQDILTRMLEAENAARERELDDEREAEHAKDISRTIPQAFEDYIRLKEKEIELLKTVPPRLNPYYKNEVNEYFKRIGSN
jgi:hypothetical protein